jgi:RHS repeat-associated protein
MGGLPAAGQWVRLEVPASLVGLEGKTLNGMAFTLYGGRATWDCAGKSYGAAGANVRWLVADQLGTPRMAVDKTGTLAGVSRHDYLPFGEELYAGYGGRTTSQGYSHPDGVRQHFTGYERDDETGLDYAQARYYASAQGRFTGVDPAGGVVGNPQTWNGYTYTLNNPVNLADPTGMFANAEYSGPSWEVEGYGDMWRRRALWTDEMARALARYQEMVDKGFANLRQRRSSKAQEQPQQQVITTDSSKDINRRITEINRNAKQPTSGEAPVPTNLEVIVGEEIQLHNAVIQLPDHEPIQVKDGYMRLIAVVVTDQFGRIMKDPNMTATEKVKPANAAAEELAARGQLRSTNDKPIMQAANGVFYDFQGRGMGANRLTIQSTQDVTIRSGRPVLWRIQGNQITMDDTTRSVSFKQGVLNRARPSR